MPPKLTKLDRFALALSPRWGMSRIRNRIAANAYARHYEAASTSARRTGNWSRTATDANAAGGPSLANLRNLSRDLARNNAWAANGLRVITKNTVGFGIVPKAIGDQRKTAAELWKRWGETKQCDSAGQLNFYGIEKLAMRTIAMSGEVLLRRWPRRIEEGLALPLRVQVLEPDFLDTSKDGVSGQAGGPIVQGVEFDALGRRVAYWLFDTHPGSSYVGSFASRRVPASDIIHVYSVDRPGQVRGPAWFASALVNLRDFDEFEDAELMRQKIAACFGAFVTDIDGAGAPLGEQDTDDPLVETLEPGMIVNLKPGQDVKFGSPPISQDGGFSTRTLRRIAAGLGVTYEDLTGDYSQVNFSSARMSRIAHWGNVTDWQWNMLIPQACDGVWSWAMEAAVVAGLLPEAPAAEWTVQPMPMLEQDREARAAIMRVRGGLATLSEVIREQGGDPETHFEEYARDMKALDANGIWLDSDVRRTSQAGLTQERAGAGAAAKSDDADEVEAIKE